MNFETIPSGFVLPTDFGKINNRFPILLCVSVFPALRGTRRLTARDFGVYENGDETVVRPLTKAAANRLRAYSASTAALWLRDLPTERNLRSFWDVYERKLDERTAGIKTGISTGCPSFLGGYHFA